MSTAARVATRRDLAARTLTLTITPHDAPKDVLYPLLAAHLGYHVGPDVGAFLAGSATISDTSDPERGERVIVLRTQEG